MSTSQASANSDKTSYEKPELTKHENIRDVTFGDPDSGWSSTILVPDWT